MCVYRIPYENFIKKERKSPSTPLKLEWASPTDKDRIIKSLGKRALAVLLCFHDAMWLLVSCVSSSWCHGLACIM